MDHKVTTDYTRLLGNANVKASWLERRCATRGLQGSHCRRCMYELVHVQTGNYPQKTCSNGRKMPKRTLS